MRHRFTRNDSARHPAHRLLEAPGESRWGGAGRQEVVQGIRSAGQFVGNHPLLCLGVAMLAGMIAGWRMKRT